MNHKTKQLLKQMSCRAAVCVLLILCLPGCETNKPAKTQKINEAAILEMTPEEFAQYQKEQEKQRTRRRADSMATRQRNKQSFERSSVERRNRLGDAGQTTLLTESANSVFPWKNSEKRQSEMILERKNSNLDD